MSTETWLRVGLACAVLLGSGAVRVWQVKRIEGDLLKVRMGPRIELASIPLELGPWKGKDTEIDPLIARATGADQIVTRTYVNQDTGVSVEMILLYGPAVDMYTHSPEVCYPTAGYAQVAGPEIHGVPGLATSLPFRSLVYSKGEGGQADLQEVYYSWWYNGRWTPDVGKQKHFERIPSMYKVHLARRVASGENRDVGNPCEALLRELLPRMERSMTEKTKP